MAHEIAHVAARHATKNMTKQQIWTMASIPLMFVGGPAGYAIAEIANIAVPMSFLKFSRDSEREADMLGLQYDYAAGYDPQAFVQFFERLKAQEKQKHSKIAKMFSTHPMTADRITAAQAEISSYLPDRDSYVVDTSDFEAMKARFSRLQGNHRLDIDKGGNRPVLRKHTDDDVLPTPQTTTSASPAGSKHDDRPSRIAHANANASQMHGNCSPNRACLQYPHEKSGPPALSFCAALLAADSDAGQRQEVRRPARLSNLRFTVVKDANDKPVRAASVILHPVNKDGTQSKGGFQLKTDGEGNTGTEGIPYGPLRIQVLAPGLSNVRRRLPGQPAGHGHPDSFETSQRTALRLRQGQEQDQKRASAATSAGSPTRTPPIRAETELTLEWDGTT